MKLPFLTKPSQSFWLALLLGLGCWLPLQAQTWLSGEAATEVSAQMDWLSDPSARASVQDIAQRPSGDWQRLSGPFSKGFTSSAVWLRFAYQTPAHVAPFSEWFEVAQPLLNEVDFFYLNAQGQWQSQSGMRSQANSALAFQNRRAMLALPTAPNGLTLYVRIATQTSMASGFMVWKPPAWVQSRSSENLMWGLFYGFNLLVIVYFALYAFWTRTCLHGFYAAYMLVLMLVTWLTGNWQAQLTTWGTTVQWTLLLGVSMVSLNFVAMLFDFEFLGLRKSRPRLTTAVLWATGLFAALGSVAILWGHYQPVVPIGQVMGVMLIILNVYLGFSELRRGNPSAALFLWAFGVFYLGALVRLMRNAGLLEPNVFTENSFQMAAFAHMMIMSLGLFASYNRLQREKIAALALAQYEYEQRQRQSDFLGLVSHELRTPLTIVSTVADNLQRADLAEPERERVGKIRRAAERMRTIIEGYLNAERLTQPLSVETLQTIHLTSMCKQAIQIAQEKVPHPIDLHVQDNQTHTLLGNALQIQIALDNLVGNAIAHSAEQTPVEVYLSSTSEACMVEVVNTGEPIAAQDLPQLFDRFYRGGNAAKRPGSGLGLYLVQQIAQHHQGRVSAENLPDGRCRFVLTLRKGR